MKKFIYKVVPAPSHGRKAKGAKTTADRFALAVGDILNEMAADGWEYVRAETLPCDERRGLTGTQTTFQNLLIFRQVEADPVAKGDDAQLEPAPDAADLPEHDDADPLSAALGDTLRASRRPEAPVSRRLGPADAD